MERHDNDKEQKRTQRNAYMRAYGARNRERINEQRRSRYYANPEPLRAIQREYNTRPEVRLRAKTYNRGYQEENKGRIQAQRALYRSEHKDSIASANKKYRAEHPERAKRDPEKARAYYEANKDRINARTRAHRLAHLAEHRARSKAWFLANRDRKHELDRVWRESHKEHRSHQAREQNRARKLDVWAHYGGARCACCGITDEAFLTLDHLNGGGRKHRQELRQGGEGNLYRWLQKQGYPAGYRVLCMNCNFALGQYGACPHTRRPAARTRKAKPK
jgi:hypothetical protein